MLSVTAVSAYLIIIIIIIIIMITPLTQKTPGRQHSFSNAFPWLQRGNAVAFHNTLVTE